MKKKGIIIGLVIVAIIVLAVYFVNRPMSLGNVQQKYTEATTNISNITFSGKEGERIKFSFRSNVEAGTLDIVLLDSAGDIVYELDKARELETFYSLEKTDTYTLQAKYTDFIGEYKINVYEVKWFLKEVFMIISKLNKEDYVGKKFIARYITKGYYDIKRVSMGFEFTYIEFDEEKEVSFEDSFFNEWLEEPVAYGAFEDGELLGFVEGTIETWNNRYRISNICVFDSEKRHSGVGTKLMEVILLEAKQSGARMVVLETQTCNENAIGFYKKNGFDIIGFDLYSYSNDDPEKHEVRIEMGKIL